MLGSLTPFFSFTLVSFTLVSFTLALAACGPGTNTSDASSGTGDASTGDATGASTSTSSTSEPTGGATGGGSSGGMAVPCGDTLPPDGSPCAMEGSDCAPDADPCLAYTGARCMDGTWHHYDVGPGDPMMCQPSCDPFPMDGTPCMSEGASCNTGCEDQCQFCNIVTCEGGTWHNMEVFPAPCLDCAGVCPFVVNANCPGGPPDEAACEAGCMDGMATCQIEFSNALACAGMAPFFTCDMMGRPTVDGCTMEYETLYGCLGL